MNKNSQKSNQPRKKISRVERLGYIQFENQSASVPCRVRDLSDSGAVLTMDGWMGVPQQFSLQLDPGRNRFTCDVVSQRGNSARVQFIAQ